MRLILKIIPVLIAVFVTVLNARGVIMTKYCEVIVNGKRYYVMVGNRQYIRKAMLRGIARYLKNVHTFSVNLNVVVIPLKESEFLRKRGY